MLKAVDIMTQTVVTIRGSATVAEAVALMKETGLQALIVERRHEQDAYGIVSDVDVVYQVAAYGIDPKRIRVFEIMTKPCIVINPDLGVEYVARLFSQTGIQRAPVIRGELMGIISITDILVKGDYIEKPKEIVLRDRIQEAVASARAICAEKGIEAPECAAAWDAVEELQAEAAHQKATWAFGKTAFGRSAFEQYCEENPDALEARLYDA